MTKAHCLLIVASLVALCCLEIMLPDTAQASFCTAHGDSLEAADVVFSGKVLSITPAQHNDVVLFQVMRIWRGTLQSRVVVSAGSISRDCGVGDCGYYFKTGDSYLVFAYNWSQPPDTTSGGTGSTTSSGSITGLFTDKCTRTELLSAAGQDLATLGPGSLPAAGKSLFGGLRFVAPYVLVALAAVTFGLILRRRAASPLAYSYLSNPAAVRIVEPRIDLGIQGREMTPNKPPQLGI